MFDPGSDDIDRPLRRPHARADKTRRSLAGDLVAARRWAPSLPPSPVASARNERLGGGERFCEPFWQSSLLISDVPPGGPSGCGAVPRVAKLKNP
jgi:hypothetical protein